MSHHIAKIEVSLALLENMLPAGSKILGVRENEYHHTLEVMVSHDSFEEVKDGEFPPTKQLMVYKQFRGDHSCVDKVSYAS